MRDSRRVAVEVWNPDLCVHGLQYQLSYLICKGRQGWIHCSFKMLLQMDESWRAARMITSTQGVKRGEHGLKRLHISLVVSFGL
jgi:hypothetical protein